MSLHRLLPLFERARASHEPLVLCTVIRTGGSTYAKPGAQMLIAADGEYAGLLSGGCLEGDLREHARGVAATGTARIVSYDLRSSTDQLFGLGAGCEGAMDILLTRVSEDDGFQPMALIAQCARRGEPCRIGFITASADASIAVGSMLFESSAPPMLRDAMSSALDNTSVRLRRPDLELFIAAIPPPPRLLLAGGGPDARPVASLADFLGWRLTVADHRAIYLTPARFPPETLLVESRASDIGQSLRLDDFSAAIVMSHHLESDLQYLRALAHSTVPYVGLLGPAARRERLLADLGADAQRLHARLRAPVGLDIGGRSPESIALSIIGEVHAVLAGRAGRPFSESLGDEH
jgi:xanthine/CO dehydrogenase XdhC/CoxF family maturation factor